MVILWTPDITECKEITIFDLRYASPVNIDDTKARWKALVMQHLAARVSVEARLRNALQTGPMYPFADERFMT